MMLMLLAGGHALVAGMDFAAAAAVWPLILVSWAGQMLYGSALIATLRRGDLSAYYPIIRSSPLFIVMFGVAVLGERYAWPLLAGVAMVLIGAFHLQYRRGVRLLDDPKTLAFAVLAMSGTGIYSLADARIVQVIDPPVSFFWVEVLCLPGYVLLFHYIRPGQAVWRSLYTWRTEPLRYAGIGAIGYASYVLILTAYAIGGDVAAVTSVRQASIPLSVLIGGYFLREAQIGRRLAASLLLAAGIIVIIFGQ